jgi:hypothetical protein
MKQKPYWVNGMIWGVVFSVSFTIYEVIKIYYQTRSCAPDPQCIAYGIWQSGWILPLAGFISISLGIIVGGLAGRLYGKYKDKPEQDVQAN